MAAAFVQVCAQQEDQDNASTAYSVVITANTTAGNRLFLLFYNEDALATAVSDSKGNTWEKVFDTTAGTGLAVNTWTCHLTAALTTSDTITVTKVAAGNRPQSTTCIELSGCDTSTTAATAIRTSVTNAGGHVSPQSTGTTAGSASIDDIGVAIWATNDVVTYSAQTNSYIERADFGSLSGAVAGAVHHSIATKAITSAATQECSATRTGGAGTNYVSGLVVFKAAAGGGTPAPRLLGTLGAGT
jgi:hypothetical protein